MNLLTKRPRVTDLDRAILSLKTQRRRLQLYSAKLELRLNGAAEQLIHEPRLHRALACLSRSQADEKRWKLVAVWLALITKQLADIEMVKEYRRNSSALKSLVSMLESVTLTENPSAEEEEAVVAQLSAIGHEIVLAKEPVIRDSRLCWKYVLWMLLFAVMSIVASAWHFLAVST